MDKLEKNSSAQNDILQTAQEDQFKSLGKLIGAFAHELNSPLTNILVLSESLSKQIPEDSPLSESTVDLLTSARRCRDISMRILKFVKRPRTAPQPISLSLVITEVEELLRHYGSMARITLSHEIPQELPLVFASQAELEGVLLHLMLYAVEQGQPGGKLMLTGKMVSDQTSSWVNVELKYIDASREKLPSAIPSATGKVKTTEISLELLKALLSKIEGKIEVFSTQDRPMLAQIKLKPVMERSI